MNYQLTEQQKCELDGMKNLMNKDFMSIEDVLTEMKANMTYKIIPNANASRDISNSFEYYQKIAGRKIAEFL